MYGRKIKTILIQIEEFFNKPRSRKTVKRFAVSIFGGIVVITTYFLSYSQIGKVYDYRLGDIATDDVRVMKDIQYPVNTEIEARRQKARRLVAPVYDRDSYILRKVVDKVSSELSGMLSMKIGLDLYEKVREEYPYLKRSSSIKRDDIEELLLNHQNRDSIVRWAKSYAALLFDSYGISEDRYEGDNLQGITIRTIGDEAANSNEFTMKADKLIYVNDMFKYKNYLKLTALGSSSFRNQITAKARKVIVHRIMQLYSMNPYVRYNNVETDRRKDTAEKSVKPVYKTLKKGLTIVRAGDPISQNTLDKIDILNQYQGTTNVRSIFGILLIQLLLAVGITYFIYKFSEFQMRDLQSYIILGIQILFITILSFLLTRLNIVNDNNIYFGLFVPMGLVTTVATLLLGAHVTFAMGIFLSVFLFMISGDDGSTFVISILFVLAGIYSTVRMERRTQFINSILFTGTIVSIAVLGLDLSLNLYSPLTKWKMVAAFLNAMLGVIMATGFLPIYENVFNLPTRFRLMELADFNHPLLKKLSEDAPSSYTHSIIMATLSERAVSSIGGDSLLARVGCLYHDIGKMLNAEVYAENKHLQEGAGKASGLSPEKYATTIIRHVTDGIEMARTFRLPEKVISFIPEHHGTSLMRYFYHEALKNKKTKVNKLKFCYPGPKPQTKETAVVMLADSIEAASRSVPNPTGKNLEKMLDSIMQGKMGEGQLDESPLTLEDLKKIKDSFLGSLLSTYHLRPQYPTNSQTQKLENERQSDLEKNKPQNGNTNVKQGKKSSSKTRSAKGK